VKRVRWWMFGLGLALLSAGPSSAAAPVGQRPVATPPLFHGNWCGLGDANRAAPIDALDAACRAHDLCYERLGRGACPCDRSFFRATAFLGRNPRVEDAVRTKATFINSLFGAALCVETPAVSRSLRKR
jgi:Phospholipase A2